MKYAAIVAVVLVLAVGGYMVMNSNKQAPATTTGEAMMPAEGASGVTEMVVSGASGADGAAMEGTANSITLDSFEFGYDKKEIIVKTGETVQITLTNSGAMMHDWVVDEFTGAKTKQIKKGETDTISFVADKAGTYEFYCSVGKHRQNGMVGKLIVQ